MIRSYKNKPKTPKNPKLTINSASPLNNLASRPSPGELNPVSPSVAGQNLRCQIVQAVVADPHGVAASVGVDAEAVPADVEVGSARGGSFRGEDRVDSDRAGDDGVFRDGRYFVERGGGK